MNEPGLKDHFSVCWKVPKENSLVKKGGESISYWAYFENCEIIYDEKQAREIHEIARKMHGDDNVKLIYVKYTDVGGGK